MSEDIDERISNMDSRLEKLAKKIELYEGFADKEYDLARDLADGQHNDSMSVSLTDKVRNSIGLPPLRESGTVEYQEAKLHDLISLSEECVAFLKVEIKELEKYANSIEARLGASSARLDEIEQRSIIIFQENDVYAVNKRIERLEASIKYIESVLTNNWLLKLLRIV